MSGRKIRDLTELATPAVDDVFPIHDTSAVNDMKLTFSNLQAAVLNSNTVVHSTRRINGLDLTADRTLTAFDVGLGNVSNLSPANMPLSTAANTALAAKADLVGGLIPANQLPSFVDDILSFATKALFPAVGEDGKIYVDKEFNFQYRWSDSDYVPMNSALAIGETASTAARGDWGKTAYDHSQSTGNVHGLTLTELGASPVTHGHTVATTSAAGYMPKLPGDNTKMMDGTGAWVSIPSIGGSLSATVPLMDGVATVGDENAAARGNHRHPVDTSRAPVSHEHDYTTLTNIPGTFIPTNHAASHATGQADAITPASIGAVPTSATVNGHALTGNVSVTLGDVGGVAASSVGAASGVASLDAGGKIPTSQLPASVIGGLNYQGVWNAATNFPALASGAGTKGYMYKVNTAGTTSIDGIAQWYVGDFIVFDGTVWDKIDGVPTEVVSVAGRTGPVVLSVNDISGAVANTLTVNGHALVGNISITCGDLGAVASSITVNGHALTGNVNVTCGDIGAVPTTTTVNGHALSGNVSVTLADVGAAAATHTNTLLDEISGMFDGTAISNKTYTLSPSAVGGIITGISVLTASGTCNVAIQIAGVTVTGLSAVAASSTLNTATATALNVVTGGSKITMVVSGNSSATDVSYSLKITRTAT